MKNHIPPCSGAAFELHSGQYLTVIDPKGEQVSDLVAFPAANTKQYISFG